MLILPEGIREYVVRRCKELFGDEVVIEERELSPDEDGFIRGRFLARYPVFYKLRIKVLKEKGLEELETVIHLMQGNDCRGIMICNGGGYLHDATIQKLQENGNCRMGIRNNRLGQDAHFESKVGEWNRVHYFSTTDKECAEIFLQDLYDCKMSYEAGYPCEDREPVDFMAKVWLTVNNVFNKTCAKTLVTEYYPAFDSKNPIYYDLFRIWLRDDFFVEVRRYPDRQEFVCERPGRYWRCGDRKQMMGNAQASYDDYMEKLEDEFAERMYHIDRNSIFIMGDDEEYPTYQIGEFRTSDIAAVKAFCKGLMVNKLNNFMNDFVTSKPPISQNEVHNYFY